MTDHQNPDGWDIPDAPFQVGMLLYPGFTLLDLEGRKQCLAQTGKHISSGKQWSLFQPTWGFH